MAHARSYHLNGVDNSGYVGEAYDPKTETGAVLKQYKGKSLFQGPEVSMDGEDPPNSFTIEGKKNSIVTFRPASPNEDTHDDHYQNGQETPIDADATASSSRIEGKKNSIVTFKPESPREDPDEELDYNHQNSEDVNYSDNTTNSEDTSSSSPIQAQKKNSIVTFKPAVPNHDPDEELDNNLENSGDVNQLDPTSKSSHYTKNGPAPILKNKHSEDAIRASIVSFRSLPGDLNRRKAGVTDKRGDVEDEDQGEKRKSSPVVRDGEKEEEEEEEDHVKIDMPKETKPSMTPEEVEETLRKIRRRFSKYTDSNNCISEEQFLEALGENKDSFFAERFFRFLDKDRNGSLDMEEITRGARILLSGSTAEKVEFVFTLYDTDGSGKIEREELNQILTSCVLESKMKLNENEIALLSDTMFDEADFDETGFMSEANLASLVNRFPDALDTLTKNASIWLQPDLRQKIQTKSKLKEIFSRRYFSNNYKKISFLAVFWLLNIVLFAVNAFIYRDSNHYIIIARGCGMCLNFTSALILLLPLRMCMSYLRVTPMSRVLPLDHNITLHKMTGLVIAMWTVGHTAAHLGNAVWLTERTNLTLPQILFTPDAHIGWIGHLAPLTGVILDVILLIMVVASRPFVRRSGYFQTFYWTHKLYVPYYILTFIHAPNFWKWMIVPVSIFLTETIISWIRSRGGSTITRVRLLPSAVTQLVISKPPGFKFRPGDYVYIKIPVIAKYEWHPFTISSAPEQEDSFWVHIRAAGHWTKTLREHLLTHYSPKKTSAPSITAGMNRRASSIAWFARRTSMALAKDASIRRRTITKDVNIQVFVDGPYGSPCREIFETEHAILIGSGIGVTPFASILQSITYRFKAGLVTCPNCMTSWCHAPRNLMNLKKVDFVWINRDQSNFEWFSSLICNLEKEQSREASLKDAISMHMFMTAAPNQYEVNGVGVQMALDLVHRVKKTDLLTGLSTRTQGGRPDFDKLFKKIKSKSTHNKIKVFFCGSPLLGKTIQQASFKHGISFSKEHF